MQEITTSTPTKFCNFCQSTLPITLFSRRYKKNIYGERKPKGYASRCRSCLHKLNKEREKKARVPRVTLRLMEKELRMKNKAESLANWEERKKINRYRLTHKNCQYCQQTFPRTEEFFLRSEKGSLSRACISCESLKGLGSEERFRYMIRKIALQKDWEELNLLQEKLEKFLTRKPGDVLLLATINLVNLLAEQGFNCAICQSPLSDPRVDHCHKTGKGRGLLCQNCNMGLGWFKDNPIALRRAANYLEN